MQGSEHEQAAQEEMACGGKDEELRGAVKVKKVHMQMSFEKRKRSSRNRDQLERSERVHEGEAEEDDSNDEEASGSDHEAGAGESSGDEDASSYDNQVLRQSKRDFTASGGA